MVWAQNNLTHLAVYSLGQQHLEADFLSRRRRRRPFSREGGTLAWRPLSREGSTLAQRPFSGGGTLARRPLNVEGGALGQSPLSRGVGLCGAFRPQVNLFVTLY